MQKQLQQIFEEIIVSRILYAAPALEGYAHITDIEGVQKMLDKVKRWPILLQDNNFVELLNKCDNALSIITV